MSLIAGSLWLLTSTRQHKALQVCYARGKLDNEGIKGYLPKKRKEDNF